MSKQSGLGEGFKFGIGLAAAGVFLLLCICGTCTVGTIGLGVIAGTPTVPAPQISRLETIPNSAPQATSAAPAASQTIQFSEIKRNGKESGWTDAQFDEYKKSIKGLRAENWQGSAVDVKQGISSDYYVEIDMPGTKDNVDVFIYVPKDVALAITKGQAMTFSGVIDGLYPNLFGDYQVEVRDAVIQ